MRVANATDLQPFLFEGVLFRQLNVHAIEPHNNFSAVIECQLYRVEGGDKIQVVLFEREEEDIRPQSKFELSGDYEMRVDPSDAIRAVFGHD